MTPDASKRPHRDLLTGFGLAVGLTVIPFAVVISGMLSSRTAYAVIAFCALVQVLVHLRYFFRLDRMTAARESLAALAFAGVLILIMVSGSLWIMFDLHHRMMPPASTVLP
jgi:cytochrome o ubiquinol oxidase operon protein cyoD